MGMSDLQYSLLMRDTINKMVESKVAEMRPSYRYAEVDSIDRANYKCSVIFTGETGPVEVNMGTVQPSAAGQVVRIEGAGTDKFVADVLGVPWDVFTPVGSVEVFSGSSAPMGWLICDGAAVSRETYAALFALIGTTYGVGDGSTTFNLPNLKGKVPVGRDSAQTEFDTLGETGGAKTSAHNHWTNVSNDGAYVYITESGATPRSRVVTRERSAGTGGNGTGGTREDSTYDETISLLQPYVALNYIIKI